MATIVTPYSNLSALVIDDMAVQQSTLRGHLGLLGIKQTDVASTAEDALRRQIESCWHPDVGARDAQNLVVEVVIDVNADRTVLNAEVVDKSRYASDPYFRAMADSAMRAVRNPRCSPLELPADQYEKWKRIHFNFDPRDLI